MIFFQIAELSNTYMNVAGMGSVGTVVINTSDFVLLRLIIAPSFTLVSGVSRGSLAKSILFASLILTLKTRELVAIPLRDAK